MVLSSAAALSPAEQARALPLDTRFELGLRISPIQQAFLDLHGFLVFAAAFSHRECQQLLEEAVRIQDELATSDQRQVNGVPIWFGSGVRGEPFLQRLPFASLFSPFIHDFVTDPRFEAVRSLVGEHSRVGHQEKDGVVFNRYLQSPGSLRPSLGWHTDGLRDLFYGRMPKQMLNVGFHLHRIRPEDGGLRLIPGTHTQGFFASALRKPYFISHGVDPEEIAVETWPGDLTVHDGRLWHRVQASPHQGERSYRASMYVPYLTHDYDPKDAHSKTPLYMRVFDVVMRLRVWWQTA